MGPRAVKKRVKRITQLFEEGNSPRATFEEHELYHDLLEAIKEGGCRKPRRCAKIALDTQYLAFDRRQCF